jgi:Phosphodiester glycosidase
MMVRRKSILLGLLVLLCCCIAAAVVLVPVNPYTVNVLLRRGASYWPIVAADDSRISPSMRLALLDQVPAVAAGSFSWQAVQPGFEETELPVLAGDKEVDRFLLARIDPQRFTFKVFNASAGNRDLDDWMGTIRVGLVINGSYFGEDGTPDTPILSEGTPLGPRQYSATHGAFVAKRGYADMRDLANVDWNDAFAGMENATVSYPLLLAADHSTRVPQASKWLANRSFIAKDKSGLIILGTTQDAFFSLDRLAKFLRDAPLDLDIVLNLDGGPVACQGIKFSEYKRNFCGDWELKFEDGQPKLLTRLIGHKRWALPMVLIAVPN